jgi:integrase
MGCGTPFHIWVVHTGSTPKAGLRQVRIHGMRHTYASLLIAQGETLAYVRD